jgi:hypothetical protein
VQDYQCLLEVVETTRSSDSSSEAERILGRCIFGQRYSCHQRKQRRAVRTYEAGIFRNDNVLLTSHSKIQSYVYLYYIILCWCIFWLRRLHSLTKQKCTQPLAVQSIHQQNYGIQQLKRYLALAEEDKIP